MLIRNIWLEPSGCPFASVSTKSRARRRYGVKIRALPKRIRGSHEPHLYSCEYDSFCSCELSFHSKATEDKPPFRSVAFQTSNQVPPHRWPKLHENVFVGLDLDQASCLRALRLLGLHFGLRGCTLQWHRRWSSQVPQTFQS